MGGLTVEGSVHAADVYQQANHCHANSAFPVLEELVLENLFWHLVSLRAK